MTHECFNRLEALHSYFNRKLISYCLPSEWHSSNTFGWVCLKLNTEALACALGKPWWEFVLTQENNLPCSVPSCSGLVVD